MKQRLSAVGIRLAPKLRDRLQAEADSQNRTLSNWICTILKDYDEKSPKKPKQHVNGHAKSTSASV